jgi:hypothetical protein
MNVLAVIVSETPGSSVPFEETVAVIARFAEPVIALPRGSQMDAASGTAGTPFDRLFN